MAKYCIYILFFAFYHSIAFSQYKIIYLLHGQGSDERIFSELVFPDEFSVIPLRYDTISRFYSMKGLAQKLTKNIDKNNEITLIGVSLGGMLAVEMSKIIPCKHTIIVSSAKTKYDLPLRYTFQKIVPIYKIIPPILIKKSSNLAQKIVEKDRKTKKLLFNQMLSDKKASFYKYSIPMIIFWRNKIVPPNVIHIHGTKDHTLPMRKIKKIDITIQNGSHMMILTRSNELNKHILSIINQ
ncbi:MAG: alpha/beta hydrolase [Flavobacteriia bacterium]|nr:alpha/beta hydrolase [Flavobacteriia bacterium]